MQPETALENIFRLSPPQKARLKKLRLASVRDLLYHLPSRHEAPSAVKNISDLTVGEKVVVVGKVLKTKILKAWKKKIPIAEVVIADQTGQIKAVWFHQAYMAKKVPEGRFARISGTVTERKGEIYIANPLLEEASPNTAGTSLFSLGENTQSISVYPETRGLSSLWFYHHIQTALKSGVLEKLEDLIPAEILKKYNLPKLSTALIWIHSPKKEADAEAARKRFAFEEIFFIQLARQKSRTEYRENPAFTIEVKGENIRNFTKNFSFELTGAQKTAINAIVADLRKPSPMMRLLEGDVGSGKTAVAAATAYGVVTTKPNNQNYGNLQTAYMVPTEILARQHFESFIKNFKHLPINIGLITSSECRKFPSKVDPSGHTHISRPQLLKWVANGEVPILIGTHSLIQKSVQFKHLAYVIIDEQHRFGTLQRAKLTRKGSIVPHLLSMTATPIPRTLALTIYGDLDLTLLDEMPVGRKPVITKIVELNERKNVYEHIREEIKSGRQAYVICPRINEPDPDKELALLAKAAKSEAARLKKEVFPEFEIGLVHSKLKPVEKEKVMRKFVSGEINILVATSVIEVGVNVPNATIILIEGAERFGLAQLHQLRGRVLRSTHQAHCYLFTESKGQKAESRLNALATAKNGFELAELDLKLRGAGLLSGRKQWGISDIGMEAIKNLKMVSAARTEATVILEHDRSLKDYPLLRKRLENELNEIHFE